MYINVAVPLRAMPEIRVTAGPAACKHLKTIIHLCPAAAG